MGIRKETDPVLKSSWTVSERLEEAGYSFAGPQLEPTLGQILEKE